MKEKEKYVATPNRERTITFTDYTDEEMEKFKEDVNRTIGQPKYKYEPIGGEDSPVDHPSHYQSMSSKCDIECIDAMRAAFGDYEVAVFCRINAMKYVWRSDSKGGNQDIEKAIWYLKKFLELGGCNQ